MEGPNLSEGRRRRMMVAALLSPPTVEIICLLPLRAKSFFFNEGATPKKTRKKACSLCFCEGPWNTDDLFYVSLVKATVRRMMAQVGGLVVEKDLVFCPFCLDQLQGLVKLRREMDSLGRRLNSMMLGLQSLLLSTPTAQEEEEPIVSVIIKDEIMLPDVDDTHEEVVVRDADDKGPIIVEDVHPFDGRVVDEPSKVPQGMSRKKQFPCLTISCPKSYNTSFELKRHSLCHSRPHPCSFCPSTFTRMTNLNQHVKLKHPASERSPRRFPCPAESRCRISFTKEESLKRHSLLHTTDKDQEDPKPILVCRFCYKTFQKVCHLVQHVNRHIRAGHDKTNFYYKHAIMNNASPQTSKDPSSSLPCAPDIGPDPNPNPEQKDSSVIFGNQLENPSEVIHRFSCPICNKSFRHPCELKDHHSVAHHSEGSSHHPFKCQYCPRTFNSRTGLRGHLKNSHFPTQRKGLPSYAMLPFVSHLRSVETDRQGT